jgi:hypothetical protein
MPQSLAQVHIHVIFSTKNRIPFLVGAQSRKEMHAYLASIMTSFQEEYRLFLQKHCLDFDEAHVWD